MLKTIKSLSEYEQLYNEYVTEGHVRDISITLLVKRIYLFILMKKK